MLRFTRLLPLLTILALAPPCLSRTWHIKPDGSGDAPTIAAGVDSAAAGDTVEVARGTYYEHDILVQSDLVLRSETGEPSCVTIDAARLGRAIMVDGASDVTIEGLTITQGLKLSFGGGIYVFESSAKITHCSFVENEVGPSGFGGGLAFANYSGTTTTPEVTHCSFVSNIAASQCGGGLAVRGMQDNIDATITDCTFVANTASTAGGLYLWSCSPVVSDCVFLGNRAASNNGGAIAQLFGASALITNCLMARNEAWRGGAAYFYLSSGDETTVSNCTIVANSSPYEAIRLGWTVGSPSPNFVNTVIAFNEGTSFSGICQGVTAPPQFSCCDIFGNAEGDWIDCIADQAGINGNFSDWPRFCDPSHDNFHLAADSPCLPENHPYGYDCGGFVGALGQGCGPVALTPQTWARVKAMYR
jgi:hypothetical protein